MPKEDGKEKPAKIQLSPVEAALFGNGQSFTLQPGQLFYTIQIPVANNLALTETAVNANNAAGAQLAGRADQDTNHLGILELGKRESVTISLPDADADHPGGTVTISRNPRGAYSMSINGAPHSFAYPGVIGRNPDTSMFPDDLPVSAIQIKTLSSQVSRTQLGIAQIAYKTQQLSGQVIEHTAIVLDNFGTNPIRISPPVATSQQ